MRKAAPITIKAANSPTIADWSNPLLPVAERKPEGRRGDARERRTLTSNAWSLPGSFAWENAIGPQDRQQPDRLLDQKIARQLATG